MHGKKRPLNISFIIRNWDWFICIKVVNGDSNNFPQKTIIESLNRYTVRIVVIPLYTLQH